MVIRFSDSGPAPARSARSGPSLACGVSLLHLLLGLCDRLIGRQLAGRVLREHVGNDVEVPDLLGRRGCQPRPGGRDRYLGDLGNEAVLLVALVDGVLGQVRQKRHVEPVTGVYPPGEVVGLEVVAQEIFGEIHVLREVPDPNAPEAARRLPVHGTPRRVDVSMTSAISRCVPGTRTLSFLADS